MRWSQLCVAGVLLACVSSAHAEDAIMKDGTKWTVTGTVLRFGGVSAWFSLYFVPIDCATGLAAKRTRALPELPAGFIGYEEPEGARMRMVACADGPAARLVFTLEKPSAPTMAEVSAIRSLLSTFAAELATFPHEPQELALFKPVVAKVPLDGTTGVWDFVIDHTTENDSFLMQKWPVPAEISMVRVIRPRATQRCSEVGLLAGRRPSWAPAGFSSYGGTKDTLTHACFDPADGHAFIVATTEQVGTGPDAGRIRALLEAVMTTLGPATVREVAPAPAASSSEPPRYDVAPSPSYTPAEDTPSSLRFKLRGLSLGVHQLSASDEMIESSVGATVGYARALTQGGTFRPNLKLEGGYNGRSKLMFDGRLELAASTSDPIAGIGLFLGVGGDGIGLGEDAMATDRVVIPFAAYYGGGVRLWGGEVDIEIGWFARNADVIDRSLRIELGYRLSSGLRIAGRYLSYAEAGSFLAVAIRL